MGEVGTHVIEPSANPGPLPPLTLWVGRAIAIVNFVLLGRGLRYFLFEALDIAAFRRYSQPQFFWYAYFSFVALNFVFLVVLLAISVSLLIGSRRGVWAYAIGVILLIFYWFLTGALWLLPDPVGKSVAAATGVGNLGLASYEFFPNIRGIFLPDVYPVVSAFFLWATMQWAMRKRRAVSPANLSS
jgi:hypothetical protein